MVFRHPWAWTHLQTIIIVSKILHEKTWTWLRQGNLKRNWISSESSSKQRHKGYIKARIDKTQQNSICSLCGDRDETINHVISESSKFAQSEYNSRPNWVRKMIHWEFGKKFKFAHTNKWYMHNPESALENVTQKFLRDFEIKKNRSPNLGQTTRPSDSQQKMRTCRIVDFCSFEWSLSKTERKLKERLESRLR